MRSLLPTLVAVLMAAPAYAGDFVREAARDHLDTVFPDALLKAPSSAVLEVRRVHAWAAGTHVRFSQSWRGLPILDREVIVSLDLDDRVVGLRGEPAQVPFLLTEPSLSREEAVIQAASVGAEFGGGRLWAPYSRLTVWIDGRDQPHLAWTVDVSTFDPPSAWRISIDAHDGALLDFRPTLRTARGNVFPTNPRTSTLTPVDLGDIDELAGPYARVFSCDLLETSGFGGQTCTVLSAHAVADDAGDFLFESDPTSFDDPLAEVQMYYHLDLLSRWFEDVLGFRHEGPGGLGVAIKGIVNLDLNNAFYGDIDGDGRPDVAFGQTLSFDYAYDGDVIIHEFGHSVFGQVVSSTGFFDADEYGIQWAASGLNEGTADVFTMIRHPDPIIGEYAGQGVGIRNLDEDRHCPTDLYGESHRDGETWGAYFWNVIDDERTIPDEVALVLYGALGTWPSDVNWEIAGASVIDAAERLRDAGVIDQGVLDAFVEHGDSSGVVGCGRVVALDDGQEPTQLLFHSRLAGEKGAIPIGQQFSIEAPELTERLRFRVKDFLFGPPELEYTVYMRRGEYVHHELIEIQTQFGNFDMPIPEVFDAVFEGADGDFEIELTADSDPPLEPGATYYFAIGSRATGEIEDFFVTSEITVDADVWLGDPPEGDDDDDDGGEGCQDCESSLANAASPAALVLLLLVPAMRRRRSQ
jgi:hypothetical protein